MRTYWLILSLAAALAALPGCGSRTVDTTLTERFPLVAGPCAAEGYPMQAVEGRFTTADGKGIAVSTKLVEGDWALSHTVQVSGDGTSPVPEALELRWFSFTEDKFYEGRWPMPQPWLYRHLKQGYWNVEAAQPATYNTFTVCMLPKGVVVVWLTANEQQVLVGSYQGTAVNFDFRRFDPVADRARLVAEEQAALPEAVQQQIRTGTIGTHPWDEYLKTYAWQLALNPGVRLTYQQARYFNGEDIANPPTADSLAAYVQALLVPQARPVPRRLRLKLDAGYGRQRLLRVTSLDEAQTLDAFRTLHAARPGVPLTLLVETDEQANTARLVLKNDQQQVVLDRAQLAIYPAN